MTRTYDMQLSIQVIHNILLFSTVIFNFWYKSEGGDYLWQTTVVFQTFSFYRL